MRYQDENIWLTQKMMAALYEVTVPAINQHLKRIFADGELLPGSVVKQYLITAADGTVPSRPSFQPSALTGNRHCEDPKLIASSDF